MIHLPLEMRECLVEHLQGVMEIEIDEGDNEELVEAILEAIAAAADDSDVSQAEDIVALLETSGDLDASLGELVSEQLQRAFDTGLTAEELVSYMEKLCEIEWSEPDDDDDDDDEEEEPF